MNTPTWQWPFMLPALELEECALPVHDAVGINKELQRWMRNHPEATGKFWVYSVSLRFLHIRMERPYHRGNMHVLCMYCDRIEGPTGWERAKIEVQQESAEGEFVVLDALAGVRVKCAQVRLAENIEPLFWD